MEIKAVYYSELVELLDSATDELNLGSMNEVELKQVEVLKQKLMKSLHYSADKENTGYKKLDARLINARY